MSFYWELQGFHLTSYTLLINLISPLPKMSQWHQCILLILYSMMSVQKSQNNITNITTTRLLRTNSRLVFSCLFLILVSCLLGLDIQLGSLIVVLIILRFKNFSCLLPYKILTWVQSQTYKVTEPFYVPSLYGSSNGFMLSPTLRKANLVNVNHSGVCMMLSCGFNVNFPSD